MSVYLARCWRRPGAGASHARHLRAWDGLSFGGLMPGTVLAAAGGQAASSATAGAAAGAFAAASALLAPLRGRLVDRRSPAALLACALIHAATPLCAFAWMAGGGAEAGGAASASRCRDGRSSATVGGAVAASGAVRAC